MEKRISEKELQEIRDWVVENTLDLDYGQFLQFVVELALIHEHNNSIIEGIDDK